MFQIGNIMLSLLNFAGLHSNIFSYITLSIDLHKTCRLYLIEIYSDRSFRFIKHEL